MKKARVIAFYLPQFHPTPENDKFWGKGFTEWHNVTKSKPLFKGHYQPKLPADLGYYDLRLPVIREQQAEMAKEYGIEGFMYWHYWFGGGMMALKDVFEEVLHTGKPDYPFCLGWANHSWTNKSWGGTKYKGGSTIFEMKYPGVQDHLEHFNYCLSAFKDKRYITVDGKPLFLIWQPKSMPDVSEFISNWRNYAKKNGIKDIHFVGICTDSSDLEHIISMGFDAVNTFHQTHAENIALGSKFAKKIRSLFINIFGGHGTFLKKYDYYKIIKNLTLETDKEDIVYPTILSGYDRAARSGKNAQIYYNYTPDAFEDHIKNVISVVSKKYDEHKIVFLKSWNEWAEGNYIEPDTKYGTKFLEVLGKYIK